MFATRNIDPARVEEAFLSFDNETRASIKVRTNLGAEWEISKRDLLPTVRTPVGHDRMNITGLHDYVAFEQYANWVGVMQAMENRCGEPPGGWHSFWTNAKAELERVKTHLVVVHRINPFSPNMRVSSMFSNDLLSPSNNLTVIAESDLLRAKAVCVLLNSSAFYANFFLLKEETTGRYINLRFYDLAAMQLYPTDEQVLDLATIFDTFADRSLPSLRYQFDRQFDDRRLEFWNAERRSQPSLFDIGSANPDPTRLELDTAVCDALGVTGQASNLLDLYTVFADEMIITHGLQKD